MYGTKRKPKLFLSAKVILACCWVTTAVTLSACLYDRDEILTVRNGRAEVTIDEYKFRPNRIVTKPGTLRITVRNRGTLAHNLTVLNSRNFLVTRSKTFQPPGARTVTLHLSPGRYRFLSSVGKDQALGLRGTIEVR